MRSLRKLPSFHLFRTYSKKTGDEYQAQGTTKKMQSYFSPLLSNERISKIETVVGVHVSFSDVAWAQVNTKGREIVQFGCVPLSEHVNRMDMSDIYQVACEFLKKFPKADQYIVEDLVKSVSSKAGRLQLSLQSSRLQLISMLVALLNSRETDKSSEQKYEATVLMKSRTHGKVFSLILGSEMLAVEDLVRQILEGKMLNDYTPMTCSPETVARYNAFNKAQKEFTGQAMLVALSFAELVIYQNSKCFRKWNSSKWSSKSEFSKWPNEEQYETDIGLTH